MPETSVIPPKPTASPFWKWVMRLTAPFALALFLVPAVYVVKYYAVDRPQETALVTTTALSLSVRQMPLRAGYLPLMEKHAQTGSSAERVAAVQRMGETLRQPTLSVQYPLECLIAKATLADLAAHAQDPAVRRVASDELGKVALRGAVIRR